LVQISLCLLFVQFDKRVVKNNNFNGECITSRENIKDIFLDDKWIAYYQDDLDSSNQRLDIT